MLARNGLTAHVYPRLMPTPMLSFAVRELGCDAGIVITASHNPAQYNGYKVYGSDGCQITQEAAESITDCIEKVPYGAPQSMPEAESRAAGLLRDVPEEIVDRFLEKTLSCRVAPEAEAPLHLIYTPLHGTGLEPVTKTFRRMKGIQFTCVTEQTTPDGHFPTCPKPNPELREALRCGLELAEKENASLLIATDPDCDRVGVAVREKDGRYTVLTGNEVGLLLLEHILKTRTALGTMPENPVVVKTIVTSDLAFAIARRYGAEVTECLTGFKYIGEIIGRLEQEGHPERYVFGFEESCGYLAGTHVRDKDGVMGSMLVAEMAQCAAAEGRTLAEEMERLYETYGFMENRLLNFDIAGAEPMKEMARVMASLRANPLSSLAGSPVETVKDYRPRHRGSAQERRIELPDRRRQKSHRAPLRHRTQGEGLPERPRRQPRRGRSCAESDGSGDQRAGVGEIRSKELETMTEIIARRQFAPLYIWLDIAFPASAALSEKNT